MPKRVLAAGLCCLCAIVVLVRGPVDRVCGDEMPAFAWPAPVRGGIFFRTALARRAHRRRGDRRIRGGERCPATRGAARRRPPCAGGDCRLDRPGFRSQSGGLTGHGDPRGCRFPRAGFARSAQRRQTPQGFRRSFHPAIHVVGPERKPGVGAVQFPGAASGFRRRGLLVRRPASRRRLPSAGVVGSPLPQRGGSGSRLSAPACTARKGIGTTMSRSIQ
jgi:hypothetical protein